MRFKMHIDYIQNLNKNKIEQKKNRIKMLFLKNRENYGKSQNQIT